MPTKTGGEIYTTAQLAKRLATSEQSVHRMRRDGRIPPPANAESKRGLYWTKESIDRWEEDAEHIKKITSMLTTVEGNADVHPLARQHAAECRRLISQNKFPIEARATIAKACGELPYKDFQMIAKRSKAIEANLANVRAVHSELSRRYLPATGGDGHLRLKHRGDKVELAAGEHRVIFDTPLAIHLGLRIFHAVATACGDGPVCEALKTRMPAEMDADLASAGLALTLSAVPEEITLFLDGVPWIHMGIPTAADFAQRLVATTMTVIAKNRPELAG